MENIKIYHNPKCQKSREGLSFLKEKNIGFEIIDYIKKPLSVNELKDICLKLNCEPNDLVRTQEEYFKTHLKGKEFSKDEWYIILSENPKLIKRPIVLNKYKGVYGVPPEKINDIL